MRELHLEVVPSLDTSCVMGTVRFIAWREMPSIIWSETGTYFIGSAKELISCIEDWNCHAPVLLAQKDLSWNLNPPSASYHRGLW